MLLTPHGISGLGLLGDAGSGVTEDEPDVEVRVLLLDEDVLLSISGVEASFGFHDDTVGQFEVWCVLRRSSWDCVADDVFFIRSVNA